MLYRHKMQFRSASGAKSVLQRPADLVELLGLPRPERPRNFDRLVLGIRERDDAVVRAGRLGHVTDLVAVASELRHRLTGHAANAVFEVGHAGGKYKKPAMTEEEGMRHGQ